MILPHEKNIRELQKVLNERYILLKEKQSISEHEYVFLGLHFFFQKKKHVNFYHQVYIKIYYSKYRQ